MIHRPGGGRGGAGACGCRVGERFHGFGAAGVERCRRRAASCFAAFTTIDTGAWGDVVAPFGGDGQPNFQDISAVVDKFKALSTAPMKAKAQLQPNVPDPSVNVSFADIGACVNGYKQLPYPFGGPPVCP